MILQQSDMAKKKDVEILISTSFFAYKKIKQANYIYSKSHNRIKDIAVISASSFIPYFPETIIIPQ